MTDDRMDALLHEVGGRWRDAHADAAAVAEFRTTTRRRRRPGLILSAAAVAAALVAGLVVVIVAVGRHDSTPPVNDGLTGTVWRQTVNGRPALSGGVLQISSTGRLVAADGCGVVGATVQQDRERLFPTGFETRPFDCVDRTGPGLGDALTELLATFPAYRVIGDHLRIGSGSQRRDFVAAPGLPAPTLDVPSVAQARWRLTGVRSASGTDVSAPTGVQFRLADNRLTTSDGCNAIAADGAVDGSGLALKNVTRTERGCRSGADAAAVIDAVFDGVITHRVTGNQLSLTAKGAGVLTYRWIPDDTAATDPARLLGPSFRLTAVDGGPVGARYALSFTSNRHREDVACNHGEGAAVLGQGVLTLRAGSATDELCPADLPPTQQSTVDRVLFGGTTLFRFEGAKLVISNASQTSTLVFAGGVSAASAALLGSWTLFDVEPAAGGGQGGTLPTITFADGSYSIAGLCAGRTGRWTTSRATLSVVPGMELYCRSGGAYRLAVEDMFTTTGPIDWTVKRSRLTLVRDGVTLRFTKQ